ncbi:hypothetical protein C8J56DRAFT_964659 [Mycena floridula]|nr:hypothetical protein C8J56DRAFT_964659 [Mycena floridula]
MPHIPFWTLYYALLLPMISANISLFVPNEVPTVNVSSTISWTRDAQDPSKFLIQKTCCNFPADPNDVVTVNADKLQGKVNLTFKFQGLHNILALDLKKKVLFKSEPFHVAFPEQDPKRLMSRQDSSTSHLSPPQTSATEASKMTSGVTEGARSITTASSKSTHDSAVAAAGAKSTSVNPDPTWSESPNLPTTTPGSSNSSDAPQSQRASKPNVAAIIGGLFGALVVLACMVTLSILRKRWKARSVSFQRDRMLQYPVKTSDTVYTESLPSSRAPSLDSVSPRSSSYTIESKQRDLSHGIDSRYLFIPRK